MPIFVIGAANDPERLWIVDTDAGTTTPIDGDGDTAEGGGSGIAAIRQLRRNGYAVTRDVDVAVLVNGSEPLTSRQFTD